MCCYSDGLAWTKGTKKVNKILWYSLSLSGLGGFRQGACIKLNTRLLPHVVK